ncbi:MAG: hypothetical protein AUI60_04085 [Thaumarchaeota archaeon 13_1_40CM_2_39_4]|nr:MAG: hypothetical protein AUI60_04085 [Thaumarchaeota archaeon 13_1_40CM_2_39_4]
MSTLPVTTYRNLLDTVGIPSITDAVVSSQTPELLHLSKLNKLQLLYAQKTATETDDLLKQYEQTLQTIGAVANMFNNEGINYAVFKTLKPFPSIPSDVDFLISENDLAKAITVLLEQGYSSIAKNLFCITMRKEMSLDLYTHPSVASIPYLRFELLMRDKKFTRISGSEVSTLSNEAEFIAVACHSFYKEQLITLNDFITLTLLSENADLSAIIQLAQELYVYDALYQVLTVCGSVAKDVSAPLKLSTLVNKVNPQITGVTKMPHKFPFKLVCKTLLRKIMKDEHAKDYFPKAILNGISVKQAISVMKHLTRETY